MKNLSKTFLPLAGLVLLGSAYLRAEEPAGTPPPPPGEHRERREDMRENAQKMAKELNLTADQQIQIEAIRKQTKEAVKAAHNDASLNEDQKREKGRGLLKAGLEQERAILTPEQQAKAKELRDKRGHRGDRQPPSGEAPPPAPPPAN
jgi:protein CpxP